MTTTNAAHLDENGNEIKIGDTAREFSCAGPCLTRGKVISVSAKFVTVVSTYNGKIRRIAKASVHTTSCVSCMDHARTQYPDGYMG